MRGSNKLAPLSIPAVSSLQGVRFLIIDEQPAYTIDKVKIFSLYFSISHKISPYCRLVTLNLSLYVLKTSTPVIKAVDATGGTKKPLLYLVDSTLQKFTMKNMNQYETCKTASNYKKRSCFCRLLFFPNSFVDRNPLLS
jgi:hypothetical protein